ncbi:hypothetical protein Gogos_001495, partial [Gossypium gossypioides]|nr:hypothetical protein [Gossypium gossypioides]
MGAGGRMLVDGIKEENRGSVNRVPIEKPPFTLGQIKQAIPPHCFRRSLLRSFSYVGCILTGVWVIAHECGHHAFSDYQWVDDTVGLILHSALLVPYFSWKISHRRHHSNTGRYYDRLASHFNPYGPIYSKRERLQVYISDAGIVAVIYVLYKIAATKGLAWLLCTYGVPLLIVNAFLVLITYLQHTHSAL